MSLHDLIADRDIGVIALVFMVIAVTFDIIQWRAPDWLTANAIGIGLALNFTRGWGHAGSSVAGVILVVSVILSVQRVRLGGGDWKVLLALGAMLGLVETVCIIAGSYLLFRNLPMRIQRPACPMILGALMLTSIIRFALC